MSAKCKYCKMPIFDEDGQCYGTELFPSGEWVCEDIECQEATNTKQPAAIMKGTPMRKLDAMVAEEVMKWKLDSPSPPYPQMWLELDKQTQNWVLTGWCAGEWPEGAFDERHVNYAGDAPELFTPNRVWQPSTNIELAWRVVEKLQLDGWRLNLAYYPKSESWKADFTKPREGAFFLYIACDLNARAPTAICLAGLRAVGVPEEEIQAAVRDDIEEAWIKEVVQDRDTYLAASRGLDEIIARIEPTVSGEAKETQ